MIWWVFELSRALKTCKLFLWWYKIQESHSRLDESMPFLHCVDMNYQSQERCLWRLSPGLKATVAFCAMMQPLALDPAKSTRWGTSCSQLTQSVPLVIYLRGGGRNAIQNLQKCNSTFTRSFLSDLSWILGLRWIILCLCFRRRLVIYRWENQSIISSNSV